MKLSIVCAGKIKEKWLSDGISEYTKRLSKYTSVEIIEVADAPDTIPESQALDQEGKRILSRIKPNAYVIVLDLHGKEMTSEEWAEHVINGFEKGGATLFSFCLQSFPASGSFPMCWLFMSDDQSFGASASASVLSMNIQG